ncbi:hypothetical protein BV22DRAFT_1102562 [Leucogyrophana mollusca]|uniref:Uncharacterized protein n=1 Tax=Leucogyrophana mollusca TaxID=85980 RepID=A0ACB8BUX7_9AGAM|nr:hypothetical protein BV22DRAFT_1102562 [Leucogyrophana mollusca]
MHINVFGLANTIGVLVPFHLLQTFLFIRDLLITPNPYGPVQLAVHPRCGLFGGPAADVNAGIDLSRFTTIVSFGDSFTDGGKHDGSPLLPPILAPGELFAGGRSTNGRVWVENIADAIGARFMDYAVSSAVVNISLWPSNPRPVDFIQQVSLFRDQSNRLDPDTTLYTVFFGINDWETSHIDGNRLPEAARDLLGQITLLAASPTNARNFLITDVYGRGRTSASGEAWLQAVFDGLGALAAGAGAGTEVDGPQSVQLGPPAPGVVDSPAQSPLVQLNAASPPSIASPHAPCLPPLNIAFTSFAPIWTGVLGPAPGYRAFGYTSTQACVGDGGRVCGDPERTFSWFGGHPSEATHRIMAEYVQEALVACRI